MRDEYADDQPRRRRTHQPRRRRTHQPRRRRTPTKSGPSVLKILGFGCLALLLLCAGIGVYLWNEAQTVLIPEIVNAVDDAQRINEQKLNESTSDANRRNLKKQLTAIRKLAKNEKLSFTTGAVVMENLLESVKDRVIDDREVTMLLRNLGAVIKADGDLDLEQVGNYAYKAR